MSGLVTDLDMDGVGGRCTFHLAGNVSEPPAPSDAVTVDLDGGNGLTTVFSGEVDVVTQSPTGTTVLASDCMSKLSRFDVESAYEQVSPGFIVQDILDSAGVTSGSIDQGPTILRYTVRRGPRALWHLQQLGTLCGADVYTDKSGAVNFSPPRQGSPDHKFRYGENILGIDLRDSGQIYDGSIVRGEGAASANGPEKSHWLVTDLSGTSGQAALWPDGEITSATPQINPIMFLSAAVSTGEAAQSLANAQVLALVARRIRGKLKVFGSPEIQLGDLVGIDGLSRDLWGTNANRFSAQSLRVRRLRHSFDHRSGFTTLLEF